MLVKRLLYTLLPAVTAFAGLPQRADYAKLPLHFVANVGQVDGNVRYTSQTGAGTLFLTDSEAVWQRPGGAVRMQFDGGLRTVFAGLDHHLQSGLAAGGERHFRHGEQPVEQDQEDKQRDVHRARARPAPESHTAASVAE